jgi:CRP-like cAMP-binding protein
VDIQRILEQTEVFRGLSQEELNSVAEICQQCSYKANKLIFSENSSGEEIYIVTRGRVRIELRIRSSTKRAILHRMGAGDIFGELGLVSEGRRSASARSETSCELITIDRDVLLNLLEKHNRIGYVVMKNLTSVLAARLRKTDRQLSACLLWQ